MTTILQAASRVSPFEAVQLTAVVIACGLFWGAVKAPQEKGIGYIAYGMVLLTAVYGLSRFIEFVQ